jgi:hypothetical protein
VRGTLKRKPLNGVEGTFNEVERFEGTLTRSVRGTLKRILRVVRGLEGLRVVRSSPNKPTEPRGVCDMWVCDILQPYRF